MTPKYTKLTPDTMLFARVHVSDHGPVINSTGGQTTIHTLFICFHLVNNLP